eukprot:Sspe_Gene.92552::Locus_64983_Transcript_1_1_Confidence_1.000_Length_1338::g.92552::m.92552
MADPTRDNLREAMQRVLYAVKSGEAQGVELQAVQDWSKELYHEIKQARRRARDEAKRQKSALKYARPGTKEYSELKAQKYAAIQESRKRRVEASKARAERKLIKVLDTLYTLDTAVHVPPAIMSTAACANHAVEAMLNNLNSIVKGRDVPSLQEDDLGLVNQLGLALAHSVMIGKGLDASLPVDQVVGVMTRYHLYSDAISVRLHLFDMISETYVHNHKYNFASMCMQGEYVHSNWVAVPTEGETHYEYERDDKGALKKCGVREGKLVVSHQFIHSSNNAYFINAAALHTVGDSRGPEAVDSKMLTLFVKGTHPCHRTTVLSTDPDLDIGSENCERTLEGEEKDDALAQMSALLRLSAAERMSGL